MMERTDTVPRTAEEAAWSALEAVRTCRRLPGPRDGPDALSDRERQILGLLAEGASNREIGVRAFVSENTVKYHLKNIFAKLGVRNRTRAISLAHRYRLLD